ncbi:exopolysaccharide biosynthesis polyprenyl glycosylphosphotransferase [Modestobacter sp. I12A-02628]|uniref:Sugar transferase n=1 Tax=Goekera deserti TaxID=2497753 RepID=A0A7K3WEX9_9ACTN|nr:sugar transferase [Goekera deserti]MPQ97917.1 exopolysaccharide biosynthesis polyprenyl glycosylphosphotransferase [Goekera deserti]NDI48563.1 exopolysaccharide biosynthesis polyprenyl glycosylphosphotransferase [Goekera deserti]NEL55058.1 sugar transferase [Goekera deserti]
MAALVATTTRDSGPRTRTLTQQRWRFIPVAKLRGEGTVARRAWRPAYVRRIVVADALCALIAAFVGYAAPVGHGVSARFMTATVLIIVLLPLVWVGAMLVGRTYEQRFLWLGAEEFRRVFSAAVFLLAALATVSWGLKVEVARGFVVVALPLATLLTLVQRYLQRAWLHRERRHGHFQQTAIIVGHRAGVVAMHAQMEREAYHGYRVIGCCIPPHVRGKDELVFDELPVLGDLDDVVSVVQRYEVDTVAVLPSPELDGAALRRLGWELEDTRAELLLAPAVTEVAGPRVYIRPVSGLPLMHVERPELKGIRRVTKEAFDRTAAAVGLLLLLPVLLTVAVAIKTTSRGPVFYRHERVGKGESPFHVLKFRTMVPGADRAVDTLMASNEGNDVQFKMRSDPRVTRVGTVLRRYSIDELPQLINVLRGDMSLVGPRPHVTREVEQYGYDMRRRLLVKPGMTGLWQVSGRSDLSWDDSVRLDVRYVENWSLTYDLMILSKTVGAVFRGSGAY